MLCGCFVVFDQLESIWSTLRNLGFRFVWCQLRWGSLIWSVRAASIVGATNCLAGTFRKIISLSSRRVPCCRREGLFSWQRVANNVWRHVLLVIFEKFKDA